jgi:hypothetical protein
MSLKLRSPLPPTSDNTATLIFLVAGVEAVCVETVDVGDEVATV